MLMQSATQPCSNITDHCIKDKCTTEGWHYFTNPALAPTCNYLVQFTYLPYLCSICSDMWNIRPWPVGLLMFRYKNSLISAVDLLYVKSVKRYIYFLTLGRESISTYYWQVSWISWVAALDCSLCAFIVQSWSPKCPCRRKVESLSTGYLTSKSLISLNSKSVVYFQACNQLLNKTILYPEYMLPVAMCELRAGLILKWNKSIT